MLLQSSAELGCWRCLVGRAGIDICVIFSSLLVHSGDIAAAPVVKFMNSCFCEVLQPCCSIALRSMRHCLALSFRHCHVTMQLTPRNTLRGRQSFVSGRPAVQSARYSVRRGCQTCCQLPPVGGRSYRPAAPAAAAAPAPAPAAAPALGCVRWLSRRLSETA